MNADGVKACSYCIMALVRIGHVAGSQGRTNEKCPTHPRANVKIWGVREFEPIPQARMDRLKGKVTILGGKPE